MKSTYKKSYKKINMVLTAMIQIKFTLNKITSKSKFIEQIVVVMLWAHKKYINWAIALIPIFSEFKAQWNKLGNRNNKTYT